jgi:hypothetical protein
MIELTRDYETLRTQYTGLLVKREEARRSADLERLQIGEQFKVLDPARIPEQPYSPNRMRIMMLGALFGLGLGVGIVAMLEVFDTSLKTEDDVVRSLKLPVLAVVPVMTGQNDERRQRRLRATAASSAAVLVVAATVTMWVFRA